MSARVASWMWPTRSRTRLFWFYISGFVMLIGAEINAALERQT